MDVEYATLRRMDGEQVVNLANKIEPDSWKEDPDFVFMKAYKATVSDAGNTFVVKVTKEESKRRDQQARLAFGLSVYELRTDMRGKMEEVFVGGVNNNQRACEIFFDVSLRELPRARA